MMRRKLVDKLKAEQEGMGKSVLFVAPDTELPAGCDPKIAYCQTAHAFAEMHKSETAAFQRRASEQRDMMAAIQHGLFRHLNGGSDAKPDDVVCIRIFLQHLAV